MMNKVRSILLVGLTALVLGGCSVATQPIQAPVITPELAGPEELVFTATESGQTALEVTEALAVVEVREYDFGVMVEGINGKKADSTHFWGLYVNGEMAQVGADSLILTKGDRISWKYEKIN